MSKRLYHTGLLLLLTAGLCFQLHAQNSADQVKAVFLFNFTQFVNWPPSGFSSPASPFVIGILGNDPFGSYLDKVVEGEKVDSHPVVVQRYSDIDDVKNCQILFTNRSYSAIKDLRNRSILTVGDENDFAADGGIIRFFIVNNKIRLQINLKAARTANIDISSKLLRLADVIE